MSKILFNKRRQTSGESMVKSFIVNGLEGTSSLNSVMKISNLLRIHPDFLTDPESNEPQFDFVLAIAVSGVRFVAALISCKVVVLESIIYQKNIADFQKIFLCKLFRMISMMMMNSNDFKILIQNSNDFKLCNFIIISAIPSSKFLCVLEILISCRLAKSWYQNRLVGFRNLKI